MDDYLRRVLDDFPKEIIESLETPAAAKIFAIREENERELLNETREYVFHNAVAQLLFTGIQCRTDVQTVIELLMT